MSGSRRRFHYTARKSVLAAIVVAVLLVIVTADRGGWFRSLGHGGYGHGGQNGWHWGSDKGGQDFESEQADRDTFDGKTFMVIHVVDGDTLDVEVPGEHAYVQRIRLWAVDTPETVKPDTPVGHYGPEASTFSKKQAMGKQVRLELEPGKRTRDKYDRLLAWIYLPDGTILNRQLIELGYGYADPRFPHHRMSEMKKLQAQAMQEGRGLWRDVQPSDLPEYYRDLQLPKR
jgi:micrococcal nuclease